MFKVRLKQSKKSSETKWTYTAEQIGEKDIIFASMQQELLLLHVQQWEHCPPAPTQTTAHKYRTAPVLPSCPQHEDSHIYMYAASMDEDTWKRFSFLFILVVIVIYPSLSMQVQYSNNKMYNLGKILMLKNKKIFLINNGHQCNSPQYLWKSCNKWLCFLLASLLWIQLYCAR